MYARVVIYTFDEDKDALEAKAREGAIPIVTNTPGYVSYGVIIEDGRVISISQWESEEHAKAEDAALLEWVSNNTTMKPVERFTGDLVAGLKAICFGAGFADDAGEFVPANRR